MEIVKKVVIAGHFGVGKTSLVSRFVHQKFSDQYLTTIGVKIDKKVIELEGATVKMMLWDIAGESSAMKIPKKYLAGAHGLFYVFDLSREETYRNLDTDLFELNKSLNGNPAIVLGNKSDLVEETFIEKLHSSIATDFKITSAKSGENVEEAFLQLAKEML
ncbi:small GTP-binding protein domain-containing protein [Ekhidna lutea]|uniref:Small GTP-binding protein domain-containing protein n=1 Tax=Ekhidna lutea TaxID=447679 RepID=A0A239LX86_EKHLU|nr:Rab family GTPase [Ekhidna lutea]SNT34319.1 small GTP-binding protein domain-containing protein [Ekhidna lutea]